MAVKIYNVTKGSHAEKAGIKSGEILLKINSNEIVDVLDYRFYQVNRQLSLEISDGKNIRTVEITKSEYDEIGLEFATYLMDEQHSCRN